MRYIFLFLSLLFVSACGVQKDIIPEKPPLSSSPEKQTLLALGDSLTAGYGVEESVNYPSQLKEMLDETGYNYDVINAGVSGDTSQNLLDRADLYLEKSPDVVLLVIGGNDGLRGLPTTQMQENIQKIIDIYTPSGAKIVLGGMDIPLNLGLEYRGDFRQVYTDLAKKNTDIYFLPSFLEGVAGSQSLNISDRIHPNQEGYKIIVTNMFEFLEEENIIQK